MKAAKRRLLFGPLISAPHRTGH